MHAKYGNQILKRKKWIFIKGFVITYYYFIFIQKLDRVSTYF